MGFLGIPSISCHGSPEVAERLLNYPQNLSVQELLGNVSP